MIETTLKEVGLSPSEIKVYLYLLNKKVSYAGKISADTHLNRTNVYESLQRLLQKGLITITERNKVKWYEVQSPDHLLSLIDSREQTIHELNNRVTKIIPSLKKLENKNTDETHVTTYVGIQGVRMLFEEILAEEKEIFILAAELQFKKKLGHYFELWHRKRIQQKTPQYSIFPEHFRNKLKKRALLKYRFVDSQFTNPATTIICGNKCAFIHWEDNPVAIRIQNAGVVKSQKNHFQLIWKNAKE